MNALGGYSWVYVPCQSTRRDERKHIKEGEFRRSKATGFFVSLTAIQDGITCREPVAALTTDVRTRLRSKALTPPVESRTTWCRRCTGITCVCVYLETGVVCHR